MEERIEGILSLPRDEAEDLFFSLTAREQADLIFAFDNTQRRSWARLLPPDDMADVLQSISEEKKNELFLLLDEVTKREVTALLAYKDDAAGGLMSPRYARLRAEMRVDEAISYLRKQASGQLETLYYIFVLDETQHLLGVISFRELFLSPSEKTIQEVMRTDVVKVPEEMPQEEVSRLFADSGLMAIPVVDSENKMKGIVTLDDIVDVVQEEATKDIQKLGGTEALDEPYLQIGFFKMLKKRAGWLAVLFVGEMLTATAMSYFEDEISKAVILALFVPLIISSGGNSGSQATTLVIRAMALQEVRLRDWWRIMRKELVSGFLLGSILGFIGFIRIIIWEKLFHSYGAHYIELAFTVSFSLIGVVMFGTFAGSMLPFLLKRLKLDPASASAPFVATLVDVSGLVIYFTIASLILRGSIL
ncbi:MAG: magnesium transporter [Deltaproteobacteria bacterium]|nr:magnesium transporter [Deltaproteobacteria bacterium]